MKDKISKFISYNNLESIKKLVESGFDINKKINGLTPLHISVLYCRTEIVKYLLLNGADPNIKNQFGETPLTQSIFDEDDFDLCFLLLDHGADPYIKDNKNKTSLDYCKNEEFKTTLLNYIRTIKLKNILE